MRTDKTAPDSTKNPPVAFDRRKALARLGLGFAAAYTAPMMLKLSTA